MSLNASSWSITPAVLRPEDRATLAELLSRLTMPTRRLLDIAEFREFTESLRKRIPELSELIPVQGTYLLKSSQYNWFVSRHQDLQIPVARHHSGIWSHPTFKEHIPFVQPPVEILESCLTARIQIDPVGEGDLRLHESDETEISPVVPPGAILLFRPTLFHSSRKLVGSEGLRRVVQVLYGPSQLPEPYDWYQFGA